MAEGLEIIKCKSNLKLYRQMLKHYKFLIIETETKLEELGVIVPTASDPLCQRTQRKRKPVLIP